MKNRASRAPAHRPAEGFMELRAHLARLADFSQANLSMIVMAQDTQDLPEFEGRASLRIAQELADMAQKARRMISSSKTGELA